MLTLTRRSALLALAASASAPALANPRRYAALSLVGDSLTLLSFAPTTGSHLGRMDSDTLPMSEPVLDIAALRTLDRMLLPLTPGQETALLVPDAVHYAKQRDPFADGLWQPNPALRALLPKVPASHLLLLTRWRSTGGLRSANLPSGPRSLEGLGFYLDGGWREKHGNLVTDSSGLVAPYVSARLSLIDLSSLRVLGQQTLMASTSLPTPPGHPTPWQSLPEAQKMDALRGLLERELTRVLPPLLAATA